METGLIHKECLKELKKCLEYIFFHFSLKFDQWFVYNKNNLRLLSQFVLSKKKIILYLIFDIRNKKLKTINVTITKFNLYDVKTSIYCYFKSQ